MAREILDAWCSITDIDESERENIEQVSRMDKKVVLGMVKGVGHEVVAHLLLHAPIPLKREVSSLCPNEANLAE